MLTSASSRRDFLKKTAYVAPLILTLNVSLAEAQVGSAQPPNVERLRSKKSKKSKSKAVGWDHRDDD